MRKLQSFLAVLPGTDVNLVNDMGHTPLIESIIEGLDDVSLLLLDRSDTDVNLTGFRYNYNALSWALAKRRVAVSNKLLSRDDTEINPRGVGTPPVIFIASLGVWKLGDNILNQILSKPGLDAFLQDEDGENSLMAAARRGHLPLVKRLVARPEADVNYYMFNSGTTALAMAAAFGQAHVVSFLLTVEGINENSSHVPFVRWKMLRRYAEPVGWNYTRGGNYSNREACLQDEQRHVPEEHTLEPCTQTGVVTPLIEAAYHGHTPVVRILLNVEGIDTYATDSSGNSAMYYAKANGHDDIVKLIQEHQSQQ